MPHLAKTPGILPLLSIKVSVTDVAHLHRLECLNLAQESLDSLSFGA
jgi:hypothetical protein